MESAGLVQHDEWLGAIGLERLKPLNSALVYAVFPLVSFRQSLLRCRYDTRKAKTIPETKSKEQFNRGGAETATADCESVRHES